MTEIIIGTFIGAALGIVVGGTALAFILRELLD